MHVVYIGDNKDLIKGKTYRVNHYNSETNQVQVFYNSSGHLLTLDVDAVLSYEPRMVHPDNPESSNACYLSLMSVLSSIDGELVSVDTKLSIEHLVKNYGYKGLRFTLEENNE